MRQVLGDEARRDEVTDLVREVDDLRSRLGREYLVRYIVQASVIALLIVTVWYLIAWSRADHLPLHFASGSVLLCLLAAVAIAAFRWPTRMDAARTADRRLGLAERLATAVELVARNDIEPTRIVRLQMRDAVENLVAVRDLWPSPFTRVRRELVALLLLCGLVSVTMILPERKEMSSASVQENVAVVPTPTAPAVPSSMGLVASPTIVSLGEVESLNPAAPQSGGDEPSGSNPDTPTVEHGALENDGEQGSGQSDASEGSGGRNEAGSAAIERQALEELAEALDQVSVGQDIAERLREGDYQAAGSAISRLGDEADQLSQAAKDELAEALDQAASDPASHDSDLGNREQQTASVLTTGDYSAQREALQDLAAQVIQSGRVAASEHQQPDTGKRGQPDPVKAQDGQAQSPASEMEGDSPSQNENARASSGSTGGDAGLGGASGDTEGGSPGGAQGRTAHPDVDAPKNHGQPSELASDQTQRLDSVGERVEVPLQLAPGGTMSGAGSMPEEMVREDAGTTSVASESRGSETPAYVIPEQNFVPHDQLDLVRDYFSGME